MRNLYILCLLIIAVVVKGEYNVKEGLIPSYLYRKFDDIREAFPRNIQIVMELTRLRGFLFYSIDSFMNQMIVTLRDTSEITIDIEFRGQHSILALSNLCGCHLCKFTKINLRIELTDVLLIQCNLKEPQYLKYNVIKGLNTNYPIPFTKNQLENNKTNEAHLWMVNHQPFDNTYPNSIQLTGCIFNAIYKQNEIIFSTISNIDQSCQRICTAPMCNGGKCLETFNGEPYCNCLNTFNNGAYCNESMKSVNERMPSLKLMISMFKLTWASYSTEIFRIENEKVRVEIFQNDFKLFFQYSDTTDHGLIIKGTLSMKYIPLAKYRLIMVFHENRIVIDMYETNNVYHTSIPITTNLKNEIFTSVTLRSGNGTIDVVYRIDYREYTLRRIETDHYITLKEEISKKKKMEDTALSSKILYTTIVLSIALAILILIIIVGVILYIRLKKKRRNYAEERRRRTETDPMLHQEGNGDQPWIDRLVAKEKEKVKQANFRLAKRISEMAPRGLFDQLRELRGGDSELSNSNVSKLIVELEKIKDDNNLILSLECQKELSQLLKELYDKETENEDKVELGKLIRDLNDLRGFNTGTIR